MAEQRSLDPKVDPVHAAHEVVLELIKAGALINAESNFAGEDRGKKMAETVVEVHQKLTAYYQGLSQ